MFDNNIYCFGPSLLINETFTSTKHDARKKRIKNIRIIVVPSAGLEPALPKRARILSPLCLPIPPRGLIF